MADYEALELEIRRGRYEETKQQIIKLSTASETKEQLMLVRIYLRQRNLTEAYRILGKLDDRDLSPREKAEVLILKSDVLWYQGNHQANSAALERQEQHLLIYPNLENEIKPVLLYQKGRNTAQVRSTSIGLDFYRPAAKLFPKSSFKYYEAWNLNRIGVVGHSLEDLEKSLKLFEKLEDVQGIANTLINLASQYLNQENRDGAKIYLDKLGALDSNDPFVQLQYDLTKGMYLMRGPRMRDLTEAQILFEKILRSSNPDRKAKYIALSNLIEVNIYEIRANNNVVVLTETIKLVDDLKRIGEDYGDYKTICECLIFQSKLHMVNGDVPTAKKILKQANDFAKKNNIPDFAEEVKIARAELDAEITRMGHMIADEITLSDRIQRARIESYIPKAMDLVKSLKEGEANQS